MGRKEEIQTCTSHLPEEWFWPPAVHGSSPPAAISPGAGPLQGEQSHIPGARRRGSKRRSAGMGMSLDQITPPGVFVNHIIYDEDQSVFSKWELGVLQMQCLFNQ